jgi:hypothetical protein
MIQGLKATIRGIELRQLCSARARHHRERAATYAQQKANMEAASIEGMNYTGGDPIKSLGDKLEQHEAEAGELEFLAAHLDADESYLLAREDLHKLGICKSRF